MKKLIGPMIFIGMLVAVFSVTSSAYAQELPYRGGGNGTQGRGMGIAASTGYTASSSTTVAGTGILHDGMVSYLADQLGLTAVDIDARLASGETMYTIALDAGYAAEDIPALLTDARSAALDQAVADGLLTQDQADWMSLRGGGRGGYGMGMGTGMGYANNPGCPYASTVQP